MDNAWNILLEATAMPVANLDCLPPRSRTSDDLLQDIERDMYRVQRMRQSPPSEKAEVASLCNNLRDMVGGIRTNCGLSPLSFPPAAREDDYTSGHKRLIPRTVYDALPAEVQNDGTQYCIDEDSRDTPFRCVGNVRPYSEHPHG